MKSFAYLDPKAQFLYFALTVFLVMTAMDPVISLISLAGAAAYFSCLEIEKKLRTHLWHLGFFVVLSLINPLVSRNGGTVLFFLNGRPFSLEAVVYGAASAAMMLAVLYWFKAMSAVMSRDRLMYVFGSASPRTALVLSMSLRYIPLFKRQFFKVRAAQKGMGLYKDENLIDTVKSDVRVFSALVTWALENGIITAESMEARGYGQGKRSFFALYRPRAFDRVMMLVFVLLCLPGAIAVFSGRMSFSFYPFLGSVARDGLSVAGYISYAVLCFIPSLSRAKEAFLWRY